MKPSVRHALFALCLGLVATIVGWGPRPAQAVKRIATIPLQNAPRDLAINPITNRLYVVDNSALLSVIDTTTKQLLTTINVGGNLQGIVVNAQTNRIVAAGTPFAGSPHTSVIKIINGTNNTVVDEIGLSRTVGDMAVDATRNRLFVVATDTAGASVLIVYDLATYNPIKTIDLHVPLQHVVVNPTTNRVYIEAGSEAIAVIDGADWHVVTTISVNGYNSGLAVNPQTNRIYAALYESDHTAVIDGQTNTVIGKAPTGVTPTDIAVNPTTNHVFIANGEMHTLTAFDGATNALIVDLPMTAGGELAIHPGTNEVYKTYQQSSGERGLIVLQDVAPVPGVGQIEGNGTIIDANGDERAFRFAVDRNTATGAISGFVEYQWSADQKFQRNVITNLVVYQHQASFSARRDGIPAFAVTVEDNSSTGQSDTFTITISEQEPSHGGALASGNVLVRAGAPTVWTRSYLPLVVRP